MKLQSKIARNQAAPRAPFRVIVALFFLYISAFILLPILFVILTSTNIITLKIDSSYNINITAISLILKSLFSSISISLIEISLINFLIVVFFSVSLTHISAIPSYLLYIGIVIPFAIGNPISAFIWKSALLSGGSISILINTFFDGDIHFLSLQKIFSILDIYTIRSGQIMAHIASTWLWVPFLLSVNLLIIKNIVQNDIYNLLKCDKMPFYKAYIYVIFPMVWRYVLILLLFRAIDKFRTYDYTKIFFDDNFLTRSASADVTYLVQNLHQYRNSAISAIIILSLGVVFILLGVYILRQSKKV